MRKRKTHTEFLEQIKDRPFIALDKYVTSTTKIRFCCVVDGEIWEATPHNILIGTGCPVCGFKTRCTKCIRKNEIISDDGFTLEVDVSTKSNKNAVMLIDKADYLSIRENHKGGITAFAPKISHTKYASIKTCGGVTKVHRMIIDGDIIDHKNGNGLDNRRSNLRSCTHSENLMNSRVRENNSTGTTGIYVVKKTGRYTAEITINRQKIRLGTFATLELATKARRDAELKYFGEFAPNNTGEQL